MVVTVVKVQAGSVPDRNIYRLHFFMMLESEDILSMCNDIRDSSLYDHLFHIACHFEWRAVHSVLPVHWYLTRIKELENHQAIPQIAAVTHTHCAHTYVGEERWLVETSGILTCRDGGHAD